MSWVVKDASTRSVQLNGNAITVRRGGFESSSLDALYKEEEEEVADKNGSYYWQFAFEDGNGGGLRTTVGLTTEENFEKATYHMRCMGYTGDLTDGSGTLVEKFGPWIESGDTVGILLVLTCADLKVYVSHNDRPLGLAFHVKTPYPKPLFPVLICDGHGQATVTITRSEQIPSNLKRAPAKFDDFEGNWKIIENESNPACIGEEVILDRPRKPANKDENSYHVSTRVVNLWGELTRTSPSDKWQCEGVMSRMVSDPPEETEKEKALADVIESIQKMEMVQEEGLLLLTLKDGSEAKMQRYELPAPQTVTENIFVQEN